MIKVLFVYPLEQRWYSYFDLEFSSDDSIKYYITGSEQLNEQGTKMQVVGALHKVKHSWGKIMKIFGTLSGLEKVIKDLSPNIVMTKELFSPTTYQVSKLSGTFKHIVILDETVSPEKSLYNKFPVSRYFFEFSRRKVRYLIFISNKSMNSFLPYTPSVKKAIVVYPFAVEVENVDSEKKKSGRFVFLFIGNIDRNKGIKTLINSIPILSSTTKKEFVVKIAGTGKLLGFVKNSARKIKNLEYLGHISETVKEELLTSSDVFIYPSEDVKFFGIWRWEEQGALSAIEAMAHGLAVIGTDSGSLPEIIRDPRVIVNQKNSFLLATKMKMLMDDESLRREISKNNLIWTRNNSKELSNNNKVGKFIKEVSEDK